MVAIDIEIPNFYPACNLVFIDERLKYYENITEDLTFCWFINTDNINKKKEYAFKTSPLWTIVEKKYTIKPYG